MTQPTTHPAAIPVLVGASIGIAAGFAGEIARTAGVSDASIRQVKTGAAAATVFACNQTPTMAAGAIGGFIAGEKIGRAPTALILNSSRTVCQTVNRSISNIWNQAITGVSTRAQRIKDTAELGFWWGKVIGNVLLDEARTRATDFANKPICQKALQLSKTTPGKALCAVSAAYAAYAALPFWALAAGVPLAAMAHERANRAPPPPPSPDETY